MAEGRLEGKLAKVIMKEAGKIWGELEIWTKELYNKKAHEPE